MIHARSFAIFFIATGAVFTSAQAQNIYRCGDSYSQSPCPGGVAIDAGDSRTKGQKAQADAATQRDRQTANTLEKERLKQEAAASPGTPKADAAKASTAATTPHPSRKKKHKEPAYFTAKTAADKKAEKKKSAAAP
ncbi:MAG: hypothetical protein Q8K91_12670 [Hylemonella sp.]|nr:hypothetical protein [Hylemonella sp.]MDP1938053.1 hypothetical protein [Hylemonella sp.]